MEQFDRLYSIIQKLRSEEGCPWDREQTTGSLAENLIEETYEVVEAIENKKNEDLEEELGDLLFLSVFVGYVAQQENRLTVENMIRGIADKLVRRHPHVFGSTDVNNVDQIIENWENIKLTEKKNEHRKTPFDGIPKGLPEIQRFNKVMEKAKRAGLKSDKADIKKLKASGSHYFQKTTQKNMNELVRTLLNYCYHKKIDLPKLIRSITDETQAGFIAQPLKRK